MSAIDPVMFSREVTAVSARHLVQQLGGLAGFMLSDHVLEAAGNSATSRPPIPDQTGCCWPLFGVRSQEWRSTLLSAFVLPLQWRTGASHDIKLPRDIHCRADAVLAKFPDDTQPATSLGFAHSDMAWPDLKKLDKQFIESESCFASLAAGLVSFRQKIQPDSKVWASAVWRDGFDAVEMFEEKLETAKRWEAREFFVSRKQHNAFSVGANELCDIMTLGRGIDSSPREAIAPLFAAIALEPPDKEWEPCRRYHEVVRQYDEERAQSFYDRVLYRHILAHCRKSIRHGAQITPPPTATHMVTIATANPQPVPVLVGTFQVKRLLILYTTRGADNRKFADAIHLQCAPHLEEGSPAPVPFDYDPASRKFPCDFRDQLADAIDAFVREANESQVLFDIDRGLTLHKIALLRGIIRPDNLVATLTYRQVGRNLIEHGTEQVLVWRHRDDWLQEFKRSGT